MGLILLEALLALFIFVAIVWWTMFSGRSKGELTQVPPATEQPPGEAAQQASDKAPSEAAVLAGPGADESRR